MAARVVPLSQLKEKNESFGKVVNDLIDLVNQGFETSDAIVVTAEAFSNFINENNLEKKIDHLISSGAHENINKHVDSAHLPNDLIQEIIKEYKNLGTVLEDVEVILNGEKIKGETTLVEKIRQAFISDFKNNKIPTLIVQKVHFGKHGRIRTSSKYLNTVHDLSDEEIKLVEDAVSKFKSIFYIPHEIEFTISNNKVLINKIKPETHVALKGLNVEPDYKIIKNSAL